MRVRLYCIKQTAHIPILYLSSSTKSCCGINAVGLEWSLGGVSITVSSISALSLCVPNPLNDTSSSSLSSCISSTLEGTPETAAAKDVLGVVLHLEFNFGPTCALLILV